MDVYDPRMLENVGHKKTNMGGAVALTNHSFFLLACVGVGEGLGLGLALYRSLSSCN